MQVDILGYSGSLQTEKSSNSSLLVREDSTSILVDASSSPCQALLKKGVNPDTFDALVLTHAHIDHIYAYPSLIHNLWIRKRSKKLIVIGNENSVKMANELLLLFKMNEKKDLMEIEYVTEPTVTVGSIKLERFEVFHRPHMPTSGYTFSAKGSKFSYFPDSVAKTPYPECAKGSDLVIHESGGLDKDRERINSNGHTTALQAANVALSLEGKCLLLIHLPQDKCGMHSALLNEARSVFPNTYLPYEKESIVL